MLKNKGYLQIAPPPANPKFTRLNIIYSYPFKFLFDIRLIICLYFILSC
uniref:Uncharacterized protein n=1 Tax=Siphoviridae sp. ctZHD14 TaxID=2827891 RepID=A0A8S5SWP2_9CAUD|nr:MAG TPA: hypothetical protein [Siphoviridae sp. ctZHD14]